LGPSPTILLLKKGKMMDDLINIGEIVGTHGVKGLVKVKPLTDDPTRFELIDQIMIQSQVKGSQASRDVLTINFIDYNNKTVILGFEEVTGIEPAKKLRASLLQITRDMLLPLEKDEYYTFDLIGLPVETQEGEALGPLKEVLKTGANDVFVVADGSPHGLLIPVTKDCVKKIDLEKKKIMVDLMEGLRS
jgi:16S rRNA processing protein RimM